MGVVGEATIEAVFARDKFEADLQDSIQDISKNIGLEFTAEFEFDEAKLQRLSGAMQILFEGREEEFAAFRQGMLDVSEASAILEHRQTSLAAATAEAEAAEQAYQQAVETSGETSTAAAKAKQVLADANREVGAAAADVALAEADVAQATEGVLGPLAEGLEAAGLAAEGTGKKFDLAKVSTQLLGTAIRTTGREGQILVATLNRVAAAVGLSSSALLTLTTAVIATGTTAIALKKAGEAYIDIVENAQDFARSTGLSIETSSRFVDALERTGLTSQQATAGVTGLMKSIEQNALAFAKWGVEIERTSDGNVDLEKTLFNLADAYQQAKREGEGARFITSDFKGEISSLIPALERGGDELRELFGQSKIVDEQDVKNVREFKDTVKELEKGLKNLAGTIGEEVLPQATLLLKFFLAGPKAAAGFVTAVQNALEDLQGTATGTADDIVKAYKSGFFSLEDARRNLEKLGLTPVQVAEKLGLSLQELNKQTGLNKDTTLTAADAQKLLDDQLEKTSDGARALEKAEIALANAADNDTRAQAELTKAHEEYQRVLKGYPAGSKEVLKATEDVSDAFRDQRQAALGIDQALFAQEEASLALADAQKKLNGVLHGYAEDSKEVIDAVEELDDATRSLEHAQLGLVSANIALENSQRNLADKQKVLRLVTLAYGKDSIATAAAQRDLRDAELQAKQSVLGVADAQDSLQGAQEAATEAQRKATGAVNGFGAGSKEAAEAQRELTGAQLAAQSAALAVDGAYDQLEGTTEDLKEKQRILNGTLHGFPPESEEAKRAAENYAGAQRVAAAATEAHKDQVEALSDARRTNNELQKEYNKILSDTLGLYGRFAGVDPLTLGLVAAITNPFGGTPDLPGFQTGGTVPGPRGKPRLVIAHGGEEIGQPGTHASGSGGGSPLVVQLITPDGRIMAEEMFPHIRVLLRSLGSGSGLET